MTERGEIADSVHLSILRAVIGGIEIPKRFHTYADRLVREGCLGLTTRKGIYRVYPEGREMLAELEKRGVEPFPLGNRTDLTTAQKRDLNMVVEAGKAGANAWDLASSSIAFLKRQALIEKVPHSFTFYRATALGIEAHRLGAVPPVKVAS